MVVVVVVVVEVLTIAENQSLSVLLVLQTKSMSRLLLEIDVIHVVFQSICCICLLHAYVAYAYYMHTSPVLDRHLTFSLTALRNISDGIILMFSLIALRIVTLP